MPVFKYTSILPLIILITIGANLSSSYSQQIPKPYEEPLYRTLLEQVTDNGLWEKRENSPQVRIDPRPLAGSPADMEEISFVQINKNHLEKYRRLIREYDAVPADFTKDRICFGTGGLQPPPLPKKKYEKPEIPKHCEELGDFVTIAFTLPAPEETNEIDRIVIRAIEISDYTFGIFDMIFHKQEDQNWQFVKKQQIFMVMS